MPRMFFLYRIFNTKKFLHIAYLWATSAPGPSWAFSLVFLLVALTQIIQTSRTSRITKITAPAIPVHTRVTHSGIGISIRKEKKHGRTTKVWTARAGIKSRPGPPHSAVWRAADCTVYIVQIKWLNHRLRWDVKRHPWDYFQRRLLWSTVLTRRRAQISTEIKANQRRHW